MITRNDQGNSEESSPKLISNQEYKSSIRLLIRRSLLVVVVCVSAFNLYLLVWLYSNVLSLQISGSANNKRAFNNKITGTDDDISRLSVSALSLSNIFSSEIHLANNAIANELVRAVEGVKAKSESIDINNSRVEFKVLKGNKFETVLSVEDNPAYISTSVPLIAKFNDNNERYYLKCSNSNICFVDSRNSTLAVRRNQTNKQELIDFKGKTILVSQILGIKNNNNSNVCIKKVPNHSVNNNNFVVEDGKYNLSYQRIDTKLRIHSALQKLKLFSVSNANFVCNKSVELLAKGKLYIKSHGDIVSTKCSKVSVSLSSKLMVLK